MTEITGYLSAYLLISLLYVILEHRTFVFDYKGMPFSLIVLSILQQTVHYFRVALIWPAYFIEDILVYCMSYYYEEDDEGDDDEV